VVIVGVVGVVPDFPQRVLGKVSGSLSKAAIVLSIAEKVDEILDLGDPILRQRTDLLEELLVSKRIPHIQMLQQWGCVNQALTGGAAGQA
jgi:hypothetical protein